MVKITKRLVDGTDIRGKDYSVWDDVLPGFGLRVFASASFFDQHSCCRMLEPVVDRVFIRYRHPTDVRV